MRAFGSVDGTPIFFEQGKGLRFSALMDRRIQILHVLGAIDFGSCRAFGPRGRSQTADKGLSFGACHAGEAQLCEQILEGYPWAEQVRFMSSGTEAVMSACRLARGITRRSKIIKFDGGYHGHSDSFLVKAGSGLVTQPIASSAGVPQEIADCTLVAPFDDEAAVDALFAEHGDDIAAIVVEPMPANNGLLVQRAAYLAHLRQLCDKHCALLVFDEVISGFRLHYGGYGDLVDVQPDIVTLGKIIGGGMPIGALLTTAPLMSLMAPLGPVYQAGTLSGNPVSVAAGSATLTALSNPEVYQKLESLGAHFETIINASSRADIQVQRQGSILWPYFSKRPLPRRADQIDPGIRERFAGAHRALLGEGFYLPPSAFEVMFLSTAHTEEDVSAMASALLRHVPQD